tara:strand:- start:4699 stop:5979 length:1281 start_codon:yes stop_codon:yes gene_type:complete
MQTIDFDNILNREIYKTKIINFLDEFDKNKHNLNIQRGLYLYGESGIGKTTLIKTLLNDNNYDMIYYDSSDIRNKNIIELITNDNMSNINVLSMFTKKRKKIVIVMDDIDGMNNGDKGGINSLIKIIRPKKTKKQKLEEISMSPIICIGNNQLDKKIKELVNVCVSVELNIPTDKQIYQIAERMINTNYDTDKIVRFINKDLRKLNLLLDATKDNIMSYDTLNSLFSKNIINDDIKNITKTLLNEPKGLEDHNIINETDRTIVSLLWHENIIDILDKIDDTSLDLYLKILENICFSDYIDRITFQKQIWEFNEMSSLIKTLYNNKLLYNTPNIKHKKVNDIRFTKVLTKYSTEYNNMIFINTMCQNLNMDKKDLISFFVEIKNKNSLQEIIELLENSNISKLDISRIYKYLSVIKYGKIIDDYVLT